MRRVYVMLIVTGCFGWDRWTLDIDEGTLDDAWEWLASLYGPNADLYIVETADS